MSGRSSIQIQALVRDMDSSFRKHKSLKTSNPTEYRNKIVDENKILYDEFPSIFEMHIEGKLDGTFFDMLKLRQKVEKKELTDDEASKLIGQKLKIILCISLYFSKIGNKSYLEQVPPQRS